MMHRDRWSQRCRLNLVLLAIGAERWTESATAAALSCQAAGTWMPVFAVYKHREFDRGKTPDLKTSLAVEPFDGLWQTDWSVCSYRPPYNQHIDWKGGAEQSAKSEIGGISSESGKVEFTLEQQETISISTFVVQTSVPHKLIKN
jgi:hypothetical protein